jgi:hypothetical protein
MTTSPKHMGLRDIILQRLALKVIDSSYLWSKVAIKNYLWLSKTALTLSILIKSNTILKHRIKRI